jgi:phosphatidylethanolamine-binding protein (PEBP) family uncharacterized protein
VATLGALALYACGGEGAGPAFQTGAPALAMTSAVTSGAGGGAGKSSAAPMPSSTAAGARAPGPAGDGPEAGAAAAGAGATSGREGAAGQAAPGALGGELMYTGELTRDTVIPQKYKCLMPRIGGAPGENVSPPLEWMGGPVTTQSFALIVYDVTYSQFHWAVWDIPATVNALPEGIPTGYELQEPAGAHQANAIARATDEHMYYGPCSGGPMAGTYEFRLSALDRPTLELTEMSDAQAIQGAVDEAEVEKVVWAGMPE